MAKLGQGENGSPAETKGMANRFLRAQKPTLRWSSTLT